MSEENMLKNGETEASLSADEAFVDDWPQKGKAGGYKFLSVLVFLISVGGLFIGLLGNLLSFLAPVAVVSSDVMNGSIIGSFIAICKDLFTSRDLFFGALSPEGGILGLFGSFLYFVHYLIIIAAIVSLFTMLIALTAKNYIGLDGNPGKTSKNCAYFALYLSLLAYGAYFVSVFIVTSTVYSLSGDVALSVLLEIIDVPMLIVSGVLTALLCITALATLKGKGFVNILIYLLALAAVFGFFYPQSAASGNTVLYFSNLSTGSDPSVMTQILVLATGWLALANLVLSTFRIPAKRAFLFDLVRFALQFVAVIVLAAFFVFLPAEGTSPAWEALATIPVILLAVATLAAFLFSLLQFLTSRKKADTAAEEANEPTATSEEEPAKETEQPAVTAEAEPAQPANTEEAPMSDFARMMHSLAKNPASATSNNFYPYEQQMHPPHAPATPYGYDSTALQRRSAPTPTNTYAFDPYPYTYDPFIKTLSLEERNEFGDLYIACTHGQIKGLPQYVIGGDNAEFFHKVWIHYGTFDMSPGLKRKLHMFVLDFMNRN